MVQGIGMIGFGYAVPSQIRTNDDPIFEATRNAANAEALFFTGAKERRCLAPGERLEDLMTEAARQAIASAGLEPGQIDRIYGYAFGSEYITPNGLYLVHHGLGLERKVMVVPVNNEHSNFITSVALAEEAIAAGRARHVLVSCGASLTRHVDYATRLGFCLGDGAGAVVIGPSDRFKVIDHAADTWSELFDVATMCARPLLHQGARMLPLDERGFPIPIYELHSTHGLSTVAARSQDAPPALVKGLLARHGIDPADVALIAYQGTRGMMDGWNQAIAPKEYKDTFELYGNVGMAALPITLASCHTTISSKYVVFLTPGTGTHFAAMLVER